MLSAVIASSVFGITINVPQDYTTIQGAVDASQSGDSILVAGGTYAPFTVQSKNNLVILGNAMLGANNTKICNSTVSGITIQHSTNIVVRRFEIYNVFQGTRLYYASDLEVSEIYAHNNNQQYSVGVSIEGCNNVYYHHNIDAYNYYTGIWALNSQGMSIVNNTVVHNSGTVGGANGILILSYDPDLIIKNNIVAYNVADGVESTVNQTSAIVQYNDVYGNGGSVWVNIPAGIGNLTSDPLFFNGGLSPYELNIGSPCINTGDPEILDPDSSRSDMGALFSDFGGSGSGILTLQADPVNPPIVIPAAGGNVIFNIQIGCAQGYRFFDAWYNLTIPDGQIVSPMLLRSNLYLNAGGQIDRNLTLAVPAYAQAGDYQITACVGNFPNEIESSDSFTFEKEEYSGEMQTGKYSFTTSGWGEDETVTISIPAGFTSSRISASPNPFNNSTSILFTVPQAGEVSLKVFDISGREIQDLGFGIWGLGAHSVVWDARGCASGIYFITLALDGKQCAVKKVVLVK